METKTMIKYLHPGTFVDEYSYVSTASRDAKVAVSMAPKYAYGFQFYDLVKQTAILEDGTQREIEDMINYSGTYYIDAQVLNLEEVRNLYPDKQILIGNMEINDLKRVVKCRTGNWKEFNTDEDEVVCS